MFDRELNTRTDGFTNTIFTAKAYDSYGHVLEQTGPYYTGSSNLLKPLLTTCTFDVFQRAATCTTTYVGLSTPNITQYAYSIDALGNYQTNTTMPDGVVKKTFIDPSGLLVKTIDNVSSDIVAFDYWSNRKIYTVKVGSAAALTEQMSYDAYARPSSLIEPNSGGTTPTTYFYDAYGLLEYTTDARPVSIQNYYDVLDRITKKVSPDGTFAYTYVTSGNGLNLLQTETAPGVSYAYQYDNLNRLSQKTDVITGNTYVTSFNYDAYNNLIKLTYPGGFAITQDYTSKSYLSDIKTGGNSIWTANDMIPFAQYNKYTLGNGLQTVVTYNNFDMPTLYEAGTGSIFYYGLTPDIRNGNITTRSDLTRPGLSESFGYDGVNRLNACTVTNSTGNILTNMTYDPTGNGNITSKTSSSSSGSNLGNYIYQTNPFNQLHRVDNNDASISSNIQTATYNSFSKLSTLVEGDYTYALTYGPDEQRVQTIINNTSLGTQYTRNYVPSYELTTGTGGYSREVNYINAPSGLCAMYVKNGTNDTLYFVYTDHLGSILKLTDASATVWAEQSFDAWGRYRNVNDWTYNSPQIPAGRTYRGFTGHEHLPNFELINMNGRIYDNKLGLFLSVDPLLDKTPGVSPYHYAMNNPLKFTDPTGLGVLDDHYIKLDGSISSIKTNDTYDRFFVENNFMGANFFALVATLEKNDNGLVKFPSSGDHFHRYGHEDNGGESGEETVGKGDHYLQPVAAAALFGVINSLRYYGIRMSFGDMSSSNGSDPWQKGERHHAGHGHMGTRSGIDVDIRYVDDNGNEINSKNVFKNESFSLDKNNMIFQTARNFGFTTNYQGISGYIPDVTKLDDNHNNHGHLGLNYSKVNWKYVSSPPVLWVAPSYNIINNMTK